MTYWYGNEDADSNACSNCYSSLLVVLTREQAWVLQCSKRANNGELGSSEYCIWFEFA